MTGAYQIINSNEDCYICLLPTNPTAVRHTGCHREGISHGRCILEWGNTQERAGRVAKCFCDKQMDIGSLREIMRIPLKERAINELKRVAKNAFSGGCIGAALAITLITVHLSSQIMEKSESTKIHETVLLQGIAIEAAMIMMMHAAAATISSNEVLVGALIGTAFGAFAGANGVVTTGKTIISLVPSELLVEVFPKEIILDEIDYSNILAVTVTGAAVGAAIFGAIKRRYFCRE